MRALDLIVKKRDGAALSEEEIRFLVNGYVAGDIPDYQISAWLMATFFKGMSKTEVAILTRSMIDSGETFDLSGIPGPFIDKHSTGGVGDKVSLILAPLAAACGVTVPMMSGRALGHTGGTLDKLDSIPGYSTQLPFEDFRTVLRTVGYGMTGQSESVVPADRLLYALRDVTGTVESIPLITASILSKKFAEGADGLVFDVKSGAGAFMKDRESARALAESLVHAGGELGKTVVAVITRMEEPLGFMVGNFLEVEESVYFLKPSLAPKEFRHSDALMDIVLRLTAWMVVLAGEAGSVDEAEARCREALYSGDAWKRFTENVRAQGGDVDLLLKRLGTMRGEESRVITADSSGYVGSIDAYKVGMAGVYMGVGRSKTEDSVYPDVGVVFHRHVTDRIEAGDVLCTLYARSTDALDQAERTLDGAFTITPEEPERRDHIYEEVSTE